jgi:hypothetical protein
MPLAIDLSSASWALAIGVTLIAMFLGLRQWYERKARATDLSEADRAHFTRQDWRRGLGVGIMCILALILPLGSRLEPKVRGKANVLFLAVWMIVLVLLVALLLLAMLDWVATRLYASRQRKSMFREHTDSLREQAKSAISSRHGKPNNGPACPSNEPSHT